MTPAGQQGAERAARSAGDAWVALALEALRLFAREHDGEFTIELARLFMDVPAPPELRAWGAVTAMARRAGFIVPTGRLAPAESSNGSGKPLYRTGLFA